MRPTQAADYTELPSAWVLRQEHFLEQVHFFSNTSESEDGTSEASKQKKPKNLKNFFLHLLLMDWEMVGGMWQTNFPLDAANTTTIFPFIKRVTIIKSFKSIWRQQWVETWLVCLQMETPPDSHGPAPIFYLSLGVPNCVWISEEKTASAPPTRSSKGE